MIRARTYADGYGRWHAIVPLTGSVQGDAALARRVILAELSARGAAQPVFRVSLFEAHRNGHAHYREA